MTCPKCGYCKECGRSNAHPFYPVYPQPWGYPWVTGVGVGAKTVTVPNTGAATHPPLTTQSGVLSFGGGMMHVGGRAVHVSDNLHRSEGWEIQQ
jgi:hypothetical protein